MWTLFRFSLAHRWDHWKKPRTSSRKKSWYYPPPLNFPAVQGCRCRAPRLLLTAGSVSRGEVPGTEPQTALRLDESMPRQLELYVNSEIKCTCESLSAPLRWHGCAGRSCCACCRAGGSRSPFPACSALLLCRVQVCSIHHTGTQSKEEPLPEGSCVFSANFLLNHTQTSWWATADEKSNKLCKWHVQLRVFACADKFCWCKENPLDNFTVLLSLKLTVVLNSEEDSIKLSCSSRKPD